VWLSSGCNAQLLALTDDDAANVDDIVPDRDRYGCSKQSSAYRAVDVKLLVQSMWLTECMGAWHASFAQFVEGDDFFL